MLGASALRSFCISISGSTIGGVLGTVSGIFILPISAATFADTSMILESRRGAEGARVLGR